MTQILADLDDINTHLPEDKLEGNDDNTDKLQIDAARFVRAMLAGFVPTATLATWDEPDNTPELIRGIAGRIIAAKYYAIRYAEDSDISEYAQALYNEGMDMINRIRSGELVLLDESGNEIAVLGASLSEDDFFPNDSSDPPVFTMDQQFA
jgi:hypothetical protein